MIIRKFYYPFLRALPYLFTIVIVLLKGPILEPDSSSYIHLAMIVSPAYPAFLFVFKKVFGESSFPQVVMIVQLVLNVLAILYTVDAFKKIYQLKKAFVSVLDLIFILPLLIPGLLISNKITSEALAYPIFLLIIVFFIRGFLEKKRKSLLYGIILLFVGLLLRAQFFFVLPPVIIFILYQLYVTRNFRNFGMPLLLVFLIPVLVSLVDKTFHFVVSDKFESTSNTGVQVMTIPFFVSEKNDYKIYEEKRTQDYFKYVYQKAEEMKVIDDYYKKRYNDNVYNFFHQNYARLSYGVLSLKGREFLYPNQLKSADAIIGNNKLLISMTLPLVLQNFWKCLDLYFKNILHAFRGVYFFVFYILLLISSLVLWMKTKAKLAFLALFFTLITFCNIGLVCLLEHSIDRFMMYHQWMLPVLFVIVLNEVYTRMSGDSDPKIS